MHISICEIEGQLSSMQDTGSLGLVTGMTQRDGMGKEVGGEFRMGNTCTPMADAC